MLGLCERAWIETPRPPIPCRENKALLKLLSDGVNPEGSGRSLYFSYFYDVTLTAQRTSVVARDTTPGMQVDVEVEKGAISCDVLTSPSVGDPPLHPTGFTSSVHMTMVP